MARPIRRAAATDTATVAPKNAWKHARDGPHPPQCLMSHGAIGAFGQHLQEHQKSSKQTSSTPIVFGPSRATESFEEEESHLVSALLSWLRRAPQGLARRRRTPDSWILLARSLEGIKRKEARGHSGVTWPHHPSSPLPAARPMKMLWSSSSATLFPHLVLNQSGGNSLAWFHHHVQRAQSRPSDDAGSKAHCPDSSTCDTLIQNQVKPSPVHPPNAGAPSSELSPKVQSKKSKQMGQDDGGSTHGDVADSQLKK